MKRKAGNTKQKDKGKVPMRDLKPRKDPKGGATKSTSDIRCHIHPN
jgi:hypothetical protein